MREFNLMNLEQENHAEFMSFVSSVIKDFEKKTQNSHKKIKEISIDAHHIRVTLGEETYCFKIEKPVAGNSGNGNDD